MPILLFIMFFLFGTFTLPTERTSETGIFEKISCVQKDMPSDSDNDILTVFFSLDDDDDGSDNENQVSQDFDTPSNPSFQRPLAAVFNDFTKPIRTGFLLQNAHQTRLFLLFHQLKLDC